MNRGEGVGVAWCASGYGGVREGRRPTYALCQMIHSYQSAKLSEQ